MKKYLKKLYVLVVQDPKNNFDIKSQLNFSNVDVECTYINKPEELYTKLNDRQWDVIFHGRPLMPVLFSEKRDVLTGLLRRASIENIIIQAIGEAKKNNAMLGVVLLNLDRFRLVNMAIGHAGGDRFLQYIAERLQTLDQVMAVGHLGGDTFIIVLNQLINKAEIITAIKSVSSVFYEPYLIEEKPFFMTGSMGVSYFPVHGDNAQALMANAERALHRSKQKGRNIYVILPPEKSKKSYDKFEMVALLRHALAENLFLLHYQPLISLKTGKMTGVEALVRMQHPDGSLIPPIVFIGVAEESGLISSVGDWVFETACKQFKAWQSENPALQEMKVAVNFSAFQFHKKRLIGKIQRVLDKTGLNPQNLELEITERSIMRDVAASSTDLAKLRDMGIKVSLDDFGVAYSSLNYLKKFKVDKLKIDQSFLRNLPHDPNDAAIINAILAMAASLGIDVTAEGVETKEQLDFLVQRDCGEAQGYYFSRPLEPKKVSKVLNQNLTWL